MAASKAPSRTTRSRQRCVASWPGLAIRDETTRTLVRDPASPGRDEGGGRPFRPDTGRLTIPYFCLNQLQAPRVVDVRPTDEEMTMACMPMVHRPNLEPSRDLRLYEDLHPTIGSSCLQQGRSWEAFRHRRIRHPRPRRSTTPRPEWTWRLDTTLDHRRSPHPFSSSVPQP